MKNKPMKIVKSRLSLTIQFLFIVSFLVILYHIFSTNRMSDNWMGPYLSAANNLEFSGEFMINEEEVNEFKKLNIKEQDFYKFSSKTDLVQYNHNPIGYVYLIKAAKTLFFFTGDQLSIIILQSIISR